jgi:hypothetical protein
MVVATPEDGGGGRRTVGGSDCNYNGKRNCLNNCKRNCLNADERMIRSVEANVMLAADRDETTNSLTATAKAFFDTASGCFT